MLLIAPEGIEMLFDTPESFQENGLLIAPEGIEIVGAYPFLWIYRFF